MAALHPPLFDAAPGTRRAMPVAVVMRRVAVTGPMSRWQSARWVLADVLPDPQADPGSAPPAVVARQTPWPEPFDPDDPQAADDWLYPGFDVTLFPDDAEGYFLNLSSPSPCFWVMWRPDEAQLPNGQAAPAPQVVTLSYHDAGRWLDAQERVDQVPAPVWVVAWLADFVTTHYRPEPKQRQRPASFQSLTDRFGHPASISTGAKGRRRGGGAPGGGPRGA